MNAHAMGEKKVINPLKKSKNYELQKREFRLCVAT